MTLLEKLAFEVGADLRPFAAKMKEAGVVASTAAGDMGRRFDTVIGKLSGMVTKVGLVGSALGGLAVKNAADFEIAMARARTMTDLTADEWERLVGLVRGSLTDLGITDFGIASEAVFEAFSTGAEGVDDAIERVNLALKNYVAQGTTAKTTLGFLAQQQAIFGEAAGDNATILDRLANATVKAQSDQQRLALAIAETAALSKSAGLTADEQAAALAVLTQSLGNASRAATAFKGLLNAVLTETEAQREIVDQLNSSIIDNAQVTEAMVNMFGGVEEAVGASGKQLIRFGEASVDAAGGFFPFINNLAQALQGADVDTRRIAESMEGYSALLSLTADQGRELEEVTRFIGEETGRLEKQFGFVDATATKTFDKAIAQLKDFGLALVQDSGFLADLKVILVDGTAALADMTKQVQAFVSENPQQVEEIKAAVVEWVKFGAVLGAATVGLNVLSDVVIVVAGTIGLFKPLIPLVAGLFTKLLIPAVTTLAAAFGVVLSPVGAVVAAIVGLGAVVVAFVADWEAVWDTAVEIVVAFKDTVVQVWDTLVESLVDFADFLIDAITYPFRKAAEIVTDIWEGVMDFILSVPGVQSVSDFLGFKGGGFVPGFAAGGYVPGTGGTDTVLTALTPGEFVVKAPSAAALGPAFLEALNRTADTGQAPTAGAPITVNLQGMADPSWVREVLVPMLEEVQERGLSPRVRSVL